MSEVRDSRNLMGFEDFRFDLLNMASPMDFPFDEVLSHELVPSGLHTISPPLISLSDTTQGGAMAACLITDKTRSVTSADPEGLKQDKFFCDKREYPLASSGLGLEEPKKFKKVRKLWLYNAVVTAEPGDNTQMSNGGTVTCRYCGTRLSSPNISVRKKHLLNRNACRYLHSSDAKENTDRDVRAALDAMSGKVLEKSTALDTMSEKVLKRTRKRPREAKPPQFETDAADEEERRALALVCEFASQQSRLMQENASLRGRMSYLRQGLAVADDYLEHLVASKVSFSRQTSINNIPPPDKWTPEWRHHMENIDISLHLAYIRSFFSQAIELVKESNCGVPGADRKLQQLVMKRGAISRFQLQGNVKVVLGGLGRNVLTGKSDPGEAWWRSCVNQIMPHVDQSGSWPMLQTVYDTYSDRMSVILGERQMLLRRLDALNAQTGPSYQTIKPSQYADSQIILDHPQPQNSGLSHVLSSTGDAAAEHFLSRSELDFHGTSAMSELRGEIRDPMLAMDAVLASLERSYTKEGRERAVFLTTGSAIHGPSLSLRILLSTYPYVADLTLMTKLALEERNKRST